MMALGFLATIVRNPNFLDELERESTPVSHWGDIGAISTPLSNVETRPGIQHSPNHPRDHSLIYRKCLSISIRLSFYFDLC